MSQLDDDSSKSVYSNTNGMPFSNGKTLHMDLGPGDLANRVICVGATDRAERVALHLDNEPAPRKFSSSRGFTTITGYFQGVEVSIVAIGMGVPMMDFFVRESRAIVNGPMAMIRFGTCGGLSPKANSGTIVVATGGSGYVTRNYNSFSRVEDSTGSSSVSASRYSIWDLALSDSVLASSMKDELKLLLEPEPSTTEEGTSPSFDNIVLSGTNVTADSFYSSQGRRDNNFPDDNEDLFSFLQSSYPDLQTMEMETFMLLHLAACSKQPIHASAAAIVVANRVTSKVIDAESLERLESLGGRALLSAITKYSL